jgi:NitT/TauT family transport system substrate-binding protein
MRFKFPALAVALLLMFTSACDAPRQANTGSGKKSASQPLTPDQSDAAAKILGGDAGPQDKANDAASTKTKVALLLNWYPEAEHGGFYAAQVHGIFEKYGLEVEIRSGGKTTLVPQELTLGRIQFGVANADDVLIARSQDVPLVALMAPIQNGPRCIMVRKDSGIASFADIKNIKLQIDKSRPYVPFLKSKGYLNEGVEIVPFFGTVDQLVAGPGVATQGYNFSEPFMARQKGVEVNELMMSEIGYNPYCSLLVSTEDYISKNESVCKRMTQASIEGWKKYLASPSETNALILTKNKQGLEKDALEFGVEALKPLCFTSANGDDSAIGTMTADRWNQLAETLASLKMIDAIKAKVEKAYTLQFQPSE